MKMRSAMFAILLLAVSTVTAAELAPASSEPGLRAALENFNLTWRPKGREHKHRFIRFYPGGIARVPGGFEATWKITGPREVTLSHMTPQHEQHFAKLNFEGTFAHFDGIDFDGKNPVVGDREEAVVPDNAPKD